MSKNTTSKPVAKYSDFFGEILVEEIKLNDPMESYTVHAEAAFKMLKADESAKEAYELN